MSAARRTAKSVVLPANPTFLDFENSDGNARLWPTKTERIVSDGKVDYMQLLNVDEPGALSWRIKLGPPIAKALGLQTGPNYVMRGWPQGYALFNHLKGPADSPRHDLYLMGGPHRFRSFLEFVPHAVWLMKGGITPCMCKYCSKRKQTQVAEELVVYGVKPKAPAKSSPSKPSASKPSASRTPSQTPSKPQSRARPSMLPPPPAHAPLPVRSAFLPQVAGPEPLAANAMPMSGQFSIPLDPRLRMAILPDDPSPSVDEPVHRHRALELDDALAPNHAGGFRWCRLGEVVWCVLDPPISGEGPVITCWPCLVEDNASGLMPGDGSGYRVRCLGVNDACVVHAYRVLPYLAHSPLGIVDWAQEQPRRTLVFPPDELAAVRPLTSSTDYMRALSAYMIAIQAGSGLTDYWTPSDEFGLSPQTPTAPATQHVPNDPGPSSFAAPPQSQSRATLVSPQRPAVPRYQGVWWGPERIWAGDLVRLCLPRHALAPDGAPHVLPASAPSPNALSYLANLGIDPRFEPDAYGARTRATFLRIARIGGAGHECRAAGALYELADMDIEPGPWDAADELPLPQPPTGYKWRRITEPGFTVALPMALLAGRYYARILSHPILAGVLALPPEEISEGGPLLSLEGLAWQGNVEPFRFKMDRGVQLAAAAHDAVELVRGYLEAGDEADEEWEEDAEVDQLAEDHTA